MQDIIPFGKYKGKPVEAMIQDDQYVEWLKNQDWFRDKYQNIYTVIINNFAEPSETPEHNEQTGNTSASALIYCPPIRNNGRRWRQIQRFKKLFSPYGRVMQDL